MALLSFVRVDAEATGCTRIYAFYIIYQAQLTKEGP